MITMRTLLASKSDAKILKKLQQLNVGVNNITKEILGSKWTIGSSEPDINWVKNVRKNIDKIDNNAKRFGFINWLDNPIKLELDWTRHFGSCSTGAIY